MPQDNYHDMTGKDILDKVQELHDAKLTELLATPDDQMALHVRHLVNGLRQVLDFPTIIREKRRQDNG